MEKKHVVLLFGGKSSEHEVSLLSAANVYEAIDKNSYFVTLIHISKTGAWRRVGVVTVGTESDPEVAADISNGTFVVGADALVADVVFPVLHGKYGEDGTVQGMLDLMGVPYVGCGVEASALCMDKIRTKRLLRQAGIPVVADAVVDARTKHEDVAEMARRLGGDMWFVKPSRAGSSVGVSRVTDVADLPGAVDVAMEHDREVLIEPAVGMARELEVAVLGNYPDIHVSGVGEIIPGDAFYSYDDKYSADSSSTVLTNAHLSPETEARIRDLAGRAYCEMDCRGLSRIDFLLGADGELFLNEINTMPGFTNISMYPKLMEHAGYTYPQLVDRLVGLALQ